MKKALIIGAAGFVGNYLTDHLLQKRGWSVVATKLPHESIPRTDIQTCDLDILNQEAITALLTAECPDYIFHLAAQSSVALSWKNPALTIDINIKGSVHLLDAVRETPGYQPRILLIGSGEEYGHILPDETPVPEGNPLRPGNIYAATKVCQNMIGKIYADAYHMDIMMVRAFNHIGPNQAPQFVVADFCRQVAEIEKGRKAPVLYVGNLSARRDFTDVRDVVRAYCMIMEKGAPGETYNIGSGRSLEIREVLNHILALSRVPVEVRIDESRLRPVDVPEITADISLIQKKIQWKPEIPLDTTLKEVLEYWRGRV